MKSNKNRDLAEEGQLVTSMMALHMMAWDWLSPMLKNTARDIEPCLKTITVKCQYLSKYRPQLLQDKFISTLCHLIDEALTLSIKKV